VLERVVVGSLSRKFQRHITQLLLQLGYIDARTTEMFPRLRQLSFELLYDIRLRRELHKSNLVVTTLLSNFIQYRYLHELSRLQRMRWVN